MSVYVQVVAQTRLSDDDFRRIKMYNALVNDYDPPDDLKSDIRRIIGPSFDDGAPVPVPGDGLVEIPLRGKGCPEESPGMLINFAVIPPTAFAIRIYLD